jgi:biotin synthase
MNLIRYEKFVRQSIDEMTIPDDAITEILTGGNIELLPLLHSAYTIRKRFFANRVKVHVINNVKCGGCSENCFYCAQSIHSDAPVTGHAARSQEEIIEGARLAHEAGAYRYCMVFSGSRQSEKDINDICGTVEKIKEKYRIEACVSAGFLDATGAAALKKSGVDRYNHNINTSSKHFANICTSHDFQMRLNTVKTARAAGMQICSGVIIGVGEKPDDIISMIRALKSVKARSVPVNFFIPVKGHRIKNTAILTPEYCLRVLCAFRLAMPDAEIKMSAGRELHLRALSPLCLYPADSLFADGYLTEAGDGFEKTRQMILDSDFVLSEVEKSL